MAIDPQSFSEQEFRFGYAAENPIGTVNVATPQLLNIDQFPEPDYNPAINTDPRHGVGRAHRFLDNYISTQGRLKKIPLAGVADTTTLPDLLSNIFGIAIGTLPPAFKHPYNFTPAQLLTGATGDITKTLTGHLISPLSNDSIQFPGCLLEHLNIKFAAFSEDDNRGMFAADLVTQFNYVSGQAAPSGLVAFGQGFYNLSQMCITKDYAGGSDVVIEGLEIDITMPIKFEGGCSGSNGNPVVISKGIPAPIITVMATVKYDSNSPHRFVTGNAVTIELSNDVVWADATGLGLKVDKGIITEVKRNDKSSIYQDITILAQADTSDNIIEIIA